MTKNYIIKGTGFTLIELLIVVAILAILAGTVIMIINPGERLQDAREATRESHMVSIGQAIHLAVLDCSTPTTYCSDVQAVVLICQSASSSPENWLLDRKLGARARREHDNSQATPGKGWCAARGFGIGWRTDEWAGYSAGQKGMPSWRMKHKKPLRGSRCCSKACRISMSKPC